MKKILITTSIYFLMFCAVFNVANVAAKNNSNSISISDLSGTWTLDNIDANDIIDINISKQNNEAIDNNGVQKKQFQKMSIPLKKILQNELSIGNTKFIFNNGTFDFYRKTKLTFSGNWSLNTDELSLKYKSGINENVKQNKIIKLTDKLLIMESESYGKKAVFTFIKK